MPGHVRLPAGTAPTRPASGQGSRTRATPNGDFAYYRHIAAAMGDLPQPAGPAIRWLDDEPTVRARWRALVTARQHRLHGTQ